MIGLDAWKFKVTPNDDGTLHVKASHISHNKPCNGLFDATTKMINTYSETFDSLYYCDSDEFIAGYRTWAWVNKKTASYKNNVELKIFKVSYDHPLLDKDLGEKHLIYI